MPTDTIVTIVLSIWQRHFAKNIRCGRVEWGMPRAIPTQCIDAVRSVKQ